MVHLILTGATGLVGTAVLHHMINESRITTVSVLSRRPVPQAEGHEKVKVIIHKEYNTYPSELLEQLKGAEGVVWAQGISTTKVTKEEYQKITYDYPTAAARAFASLTPPSAPFKFIYVSGEGATTKPSILTAHFGVIKGRAEAALLALPKDSSYVNLRPFSVRPGGVDPSTQPEIHRYIQESSGLAGIASKVLLPVLRVGVPSMISPTKDLAKVLTDLAMGDGEPLSGKGVNDEGRILANVGLRRLAGI